MKTKNNLSKCIAKIEQKMLDRNQETLTFQAISGKEIGGSNSLCENNFCDGSLNRTCANGVCDGSASIKKCKEILIIT